jgi:hypothetical protein
MFCWIDNILQNIRVILEFNMSYGRGLVLLLIKPRMFGKFVVHAWR